MADDDKMVDFTYTANNFPFHPDCYEWPTVQAITTDGEAISLDVHCICDTKRQEFDLVGFLGHNREDQISEVIFLAKEMDAQVIMFKGVGFTDEILNALMANMQEPNPEEFPGQKISLVVPDWPSRFQYKVLREARDMCRHGDFHESSLAYRLNASVEEIHQHLELLSDPGGLHAVRSHQRHTEVLGPTAPPRPARCSYRPWANTTRTWSARRHMRCLI
jgi:hypothetical protein